MKHTTMC